MSNKDSGQYPEEFDEKRLEGKSRGDADSDDSDSEDSDSDDQHIVIDLNIGLDEDVVDLGKQLLDTLADDDTDSEESENGESSDPD